jgi:uncharacterized protein YjiS (DUF1127 family)
MQRRTTSLDPVEQPYEVQTGYRTGLFVAIGQRLRSAVAGYVFWRRCMQDIKHLERLDDRMLADVGVRRQDIERRVLHG